MRRLVPILAVLCALAAVIVLIGSNAFSIVTVTAPAALKPSPSASPTEGPQCGSALPWNFYRQPNNSFGPRVWEKLPAVSHEAYKRLCGNDQQGGDPALLMAHLGVIANSDPNQMLQGLSRDEWLSLVREYVAGLGISPTGDMRVGQVQYEGPQWLYTLYMLPPATPGGPPVIRLTRKYEPASWYWYVPVRWRGTTVALKERLDCGLQPGFGSLADVPTALPAFLA